MTNDGVSSCPQTSAVAAHGQNFPLIRDLLGQHGVGRPRSIVARFFGRSPLGRHATLMFRAASGELAIVDALRQLGPEWVVVDSVPAKSGVESIDYVVIGPAGTFAIVVRNHVGGAMWVRENVVLVDGEPVSHIRDSEAAALRCAVQLSGALGEGVQVTPCLVLIGPRSVTVTRAPRRVAILSPRELKPWLRSLPNTVSLEQRERLHTAAIEPTTMHDGRCRVEDPTLALGLFRTLKADMNQARRIRLAWATGSLLLLWIILMAGAGGITLGLLLR